MRGQRLTVEQSRWLQDYGIEDTKNYLMQKNSSTTFQVVEKNTGNIIKFEKVRNGREIGLELIGVKNKEGATFCGAAH